MFKFWLIAAFLMLANQVPTSRSQDPVPPDSPDSAPVPDCPVGCTCSRPSTDSVTVNCTLQSPNLPTVFPIGTRSLQLDCNNTFVLTPASRMFSAIESLRNITSLNITRCINQPALAIGMFSGLNLLRYLILEQNHIETLSPGVFNDTASVYNLELRNSSIRRIEPNTFDNLPECNWILLNRNHLTSVDISAFGNINDAASVVFNGNPIVCDCGLIPVWQRFHPSNQNTQCPGGNLLVNRTWADINETLLNATCAGTPTDPSASPTDPSAPPPQPSEAPANQTGGTNPQPAGGISTALFIIGILLTSILAIACCSFCVFQTISRNSGREIETGPPTLKKCEEPAKKESEFVLLPTEKQSNVEEPAKVGVGKDGKSSFEDEKTVRSIS